MFGFQFWWGRWPWTRYYLTWLWHILWMEEILHQLIDGLSRCNPIMHSVSELPIVTNCCRTFFHYGRVWKCGTLFSGQALVQPCTWSLRWRVAAPRNGTPRWGDFGRKFPGKPSRTNSTNRNEWWFHGFLWDMIRYDLWFNLELTKTLKNGLGNWRWGMPPPNMDIWQRKNWR